MIRSFNDDDTEAIFNYRRARCFPPGIHRSALRKLQYLNVARKLDDLREPPGNLTWRSWQESGRGSTASVSTINGGFASSGATATRIGLK